MNLACVNAIPDPDHITSTRRDNLPFASHRERERRMGRYPEATLIVASDLSVSLSCPYLGNTGTGAAVGELARVTPTDPSADRLCDNLNSQRKEG